MSCFCPYCGRKFTRNEHLERHIFTHTNVKPYVCSVCHLSFSRRDVLKKHVVIHSDNVDQLSSYEKKERSRTSNACDNCVKTKAKCDISSPCGRCKLKSLACSRRRARQRSTSCSSQEIRNQNITEHRPSSAGPENSAEQFSLSASLPNRKRRRMASPMLMSDALLDQSDYRVSLETHPEVSGSVLAEQTGLPFGPPSSENYIPSLSQMGTSLNPLDGTALPGGTPMLMQWENATYFPLSGFERASQSNSGQTAADLIPLSNQDHHVSAEEATASSQPMTHTLNTGFAYDPLAAPLQDQEETQLRLSPARMFSGMMDHPSIIEAQHFWSSFQCNPRPSDGKKCPKTAGILLQNLSYMPETDDDWIWNTFDFSSPEGESSCSWPTSLSFSEHARDRLLAIAQAFLRKALEIHQLDDRVILANSPTSINQDNRHIWVLALPPSTTLEHFLREYRRLFEPFYNLAPSGTLDPNSLMSSDNETLSVLLILLMIAQGASSDPTPEARRLSGGLTEVCRISLFDTVERNTLLCDHPLLLHCGLLFVSQAAWSGDKMLMDIGMGQRGIYIAMARHTGLFDQEQLPAADPTNGDPPERTTWVERENLTRLTHAWVFLDQELCLFYDAMPAITIAELNLPLPSSDHVWSTEDASWQGHFAREGSDPNPWRGTPSKQISLRVLFQVFLDDGIERRGIQMDAQVLRLLLYPLQFLINDHRNILRCCPSTRSYPLNQKSVLLRIEETQRLLQRWLSLYHSYKSMVTEQEDSPSMTAALVIYHLLNLNAVTSFRDIESLTRGSATDTELRNKSSLIKECLQSADDAVLHAGQVLYRVRAFAKKARPPWWPAALYRATLILWACTVLGGITSNHPSLTSIPDLTIDRAVEPGRVQEYLSDGACRPMLTGRLGESVPLEEPTTVVNVCLASFEEGVATRFSDGIRRKLEQFIIRRQKLNR